MVASIKHGDTFLRTVTVSRSGVAVDLTSVTIASQVRNQSGTLLSTLTIVPTDLAGGVFQVQGETSAWPVAVLSWDVEFVEGGRTWSLPTQTLNVVQDITQ